MKNFDNSTRIKRNRGFGFQPKCCSPLRLEASATFHRNGLAPLEMVLVLPLLMTLMATLMVFGYAAMWKLRTETVARDLAWRSRFQQFANDNSQAIEWPDNAEMDVRSGSELSTFDAETILHDPIIAGPLGNLEVNASVLNYSRGNLTGLATIQRDPPVFAQLTSFDFQVDHALLDDRFQFRQMGIANVSRRIPVIYETGLEEILDSPEMQAAVAALEQAITSFND